MTNFLDQGKKKFWDYVWDNPVQSFIAVAVVVCLGPSMYHNNQQNNKPSIARAETPAILASSPVIPPAGTPTPKPSGVKTGTIATTLYGAPFTITEEVLIPLRQAIVDGKMSKFEAALTASLHTIESAGGKWESLGCNVNNPDPIAACAWGVGGRGYGRYGTGLTQIMNYPEWEESTAYAGITTTPAQAIKDPAAQIVVIRAHMLRITGDMSNRDTLDMDLVMSMANKWLGTGCDMHGTCTNKYANQIKAIMPTVFEQI